MAQLLDSIRASRRCTDAFAFGCEPLAVDTQHDFPTEVGARVVERIVELVEAGDQLRIGDRCWHGNRFRRHLTGHKI